MQKQKSERRGTIYTKTEEIRMSNLLSKLTKRHKKNTEISMSVEEYLELCKEDPFAYASPAERMLKAIGEPELLDTRKDPRLSRIFQNKIIKRWKCFEDFFGIEEVLERLVDYFKHSAQGLEESKQILYLLGPVGGSKSTISERLKQLMETQPFFAIEGSPVNDSPLALFKQFEDGEELELVYGIPRSRLIHKPSPWLVKHLKMIDGDFTKLRVVKRFPSINDQVGLARTEPGDENNQDISALVGKIDIRKLERYSPNDPDAYSYSGGLCLANRGMLEFVEMFKAPIKVLHPLLTATQDRIYNGTESISALPFDGIILAHSNESEWESFKNDKKNEAFIDRVYIVKVPYCLRITEEIDIYKKLLKSSSLKDAPCAPKTLELLATFCVLSRLGDASGENNDLHIKSRVYNGENVKAEVNTVKPIHTYHKEAGVAEGMKEGVSPRFAFKVLSKVFNYDTEEISANPVHLMKVLEDAVRHEQFDPTKEQLLLGFIKTVLKKIYDEHIFKEIPIAYLDAYNDFGQNIFDRYITHAEYWLEDADYRDPNTGVLLSRDQLEKSLQEVEVPAGIVNPSEFREDVVRFCLRARVDKKDVKWTDYEKLRSVIEKRLLCKTEDILPIISFEVQKSDEDSKKHKNFVKRLCEMGYTEKQVRIIVQYYIQNKDRQT